MDLLLFLPFIAFVIALFTAQAGVSGAFLLLPFQISVLGFTSPAVSSTNLVYNLVAIPSGVFRYVQEKRMAWPITLVIIIGTLPGVFIGAFFRVGYLVDVKTFKLFVGLVLLYLGLRLIYSTFYPNEKLKELEKKFNEKVEKLKRQQKKKIAAGLPDVAVKMKRFGLTTTYEFWEEEFSFSTIGLLLLSFAVGIIGGAYGIGGGAIIAPFIVAVFGLPTYTIAGATLMATLLTSVVGVVYYTHLGYPPNWIVGILFGIGGFFGMYFGARLQKYMPERVIRVFLSVLILLLSARYILQYFV